MLRKISSFLWLSSLVLCSLSAQQIEDQFPAHPFGWPRPVIRFTPEDASDYLLGLVDQDMLWKEREDTLRLSLLRLIDHFTEPFDSVKTRLKTYPFDSLELAPAYLVQHDTLPLRWLDGHVFFVDTVALQKAPFIIQQTVRLKALDTLSVPVNGEWNGLHLMLDSLLSVRDTITERLIDYAYLEEKNIQLHQVEDQRIQPPLLPPGSALHWHFINDSTQMVLTDTTQVIMGSEHSPFHIARGMQMPDSLHRAVETLIAYTHERDSVLLFFQDIEGRKTPFWLSSAKEDLYRYWVKNAEQDSITVWIGNPSKYDISLVLEDDVHLERMEIQTADDIPITTARPLRSLASLQPLQEIPVHWRYELNSSFSLNQNYLSNWARGGESSFSSMLDVRGRALYSNAETKTKWTSSGRLRYGTMRTRETGFRTSADIVEINSQFNKDLLRNLDFSSVLYFKTQVAKGYRLPNDSVPISKFLNPGALTLGVGVEYEPFKDTQINFSPLSYRNTFVLDTANIRPATHGVEAGRRSRQEMGGQLVIKNKFSVMEGLEVTNAARLFSNYLQDPLKVDVDWEISLEKQINWYFTIRLNLHMIYDHNILFAVLDEDGQPVLLPDDSEKKEPRLQLNQFMGLTLSFRL